MSEVRVTPMAPGEFGVELSEGHERTGHVVTLPEDFALDFGVPEAEPERIVRESFQFLLEREPPGAILREFSLSDITRYFPEYPEELRRRLT
jgi:hypothetical protein